MISKFFINRPIFATVIAILMVLVGLITVKTLPVAQFPDITPPTVMVIANYPGADAETVAKVVGEPIEEQVNGVEDMLYMSSNSGSDGSYTLTITFKNGTDLDEATVKVQNRVAQVQSQLPEDVQQQGVTVTSRSTNIILFIALESDSVHHYSDLYLTNYAQLNIVDELSRLEGVGSVSAFGGGDYSMRIWLNTSEMKARGLTPDDVRQAIEARNIEVSAGTVGAPPSSVPASFQYTLTATGSLSTVKEFGDIIIRRNADGGMLRLRDIARIELGSESYGTLASVSGHSAGLIGVYQLPGANALDVAKRVEDKMQDLQPYFPPGVHYRVVMDTTGFVNASIDDVLVTFVETTLIVMIVIMIFLQNLRAVIIPMLTIPVSLIATFAVMKLMGFSLNTLTLFGLVLAVAIVVDDAIVVVEDCARIISKRILTPKQGAMKAMRELQGPIIGEVLVLLSVFIPTAFISGITGELYKQFALTIAVSTAFSGFNALTFTPAMCALFLKPVDPDKKKFFFFRWFNKGWAKTVTAYTNIVGKFLRRPLVALGIYALLCVAAFWGFMKWPTSYVPEEDLGYFMATVQLPTNTALSETKRVTDEVEHRLLAYDEVENVIAITGTSFMGGGNSSNYGSFFVILKPWSERKAKDEKVFALLDRVSADMENIQEGVVFALNPPAIPGLGMTSGAQMQLLDINNRGAQGLAQAIDAIKEKAKTDPRIASVTSMYQGEVPQYTVTVDRDKAELHNLDVSTIFSTLSSYMGISFVNDFVKFGRTYQVNISAMDADRATPDKVMELNVCNTDGKMVPFSSFATITPTMGSASVDRYNMYTTASVTATPAHGTSSSEAIEAMEDIVNEAVGDNYSYAWTGQAYQETQAGTTITVVLIFAVIITILVLAAQYESWSDPIAVILSMPTAILGTIVGCMFMSQDISIYTQIGIILLLGLSAKNAILIVEYAMDYRKQGMDISTAAQQAGKVRFRPIMMTALAFVFGVMPMLFANGAGAASQKSLGCAVVFGMAINAFVGTLFVPNFWELMQRLHEKLSPRKSALPPTGATQPADDANAQTSHAQASPVVTVSPQTEESAAEASADSAKGSQEGPKDSAGAAKDSQDVAKDSPKGV